MITEKRKKLETAMRRFDKVLIAYSGGVDSTLLLKIAVDVLGKDRVLAVTGVSQTYTEEEESLARKLAGTLGVEHILLHTNELEDASFAENPQDRCYYCKRALFEKIIGIARQRGLSAVLDATNHDDLSDFRPGRKASEELGVVSPFVSVGMNKDEIRSLSREYGLETWNKPANPCLASRVPYGTRITQDVLRQIDEGEKFLRNLGFRTVRLRHHGAVARIEVPEEELEKIIDPGTRLKIAVFMRKIGYIWIALDLEGYRSGSLNERAL